MDQMKNGPNQMCSSSKFLEHHIYGSQRYLCGIEQAGRVVVPNQVVQGDVSGCAGASKVTFPLIEIVPSETRCLDGHRSLEPLRGKGLPNG
jgi:hypothetical protein